MKNKFLLILTALFFMTSISGCKMVKGAGKDVEDAGKNIQKSADEHN